MSASQRLVDELPDIDVANAFSAQKTKDLAKAQLKCLPDEFIELANLTLGGDGAQEVAELEYKVANEKGSAKLLGEQSI